MDAPDPCTWSIALAPPPPGGASRVALARATERIAADHLAGVLDDVPGGVRLRRTRPSVR